MEPDLVLEPFLYPPRLKGHRNNEKLAPWAHDTDLPVDLPSPRVGPVIECHDGPTGFCGYQSNYHYENVTGLAGFQNSVPVSGGFCHSDGNSCSLSHTSCGFLLGLEGTESFTITEIEEAVVEGDVLQIAAFLSSGRVVFNRARSSLQVKNCSGNRLVANVPMSLPLIVALDRHLNEDPREMFGGFGRVRSSTVAVVDHL